MQARFGVRVDDPASSVVPACCNKIGKRFVATILTRRSDRTVVFHLENLHKALVYQPHVSWWLGRTECLLHSPITHDYKPANLLQLITPALQEPLRNVRMRIKFTLIEAVRSEYSNDVGWRCHLAHRHVRSGQVDRCARAGQSAANVCSSSNDARWGCATYGPQFGSWF